MNRVAWRPIYISIVASVIAGIVLHYVVLLPLPFTAIFCILALLVPLVAAQYFHSINLEKRFGSIIGAVKLVVDALLGIRSKLSKMPKDEAITVDGLSSIFDEAASAISDTLLNAYFKSLGATSSNPNYEASRKRELLERARRREITYEEAEELRRLLDREKAEREQAGDVSGAILVGLLILFVLAVIASLSARR